jgi:NAD(P)-dependent dehydrogenase (short-subunit alcohol dehydrogenase family)
LLDFKIFTAADQRKFAALTGDFNPMHMDPIAARRTQAGAPVVHGIHTLLWLLDFVGARHAEIENPASLKVRFSKMLYLGDRVEARIVQSSSTSLRAQGFVDGVEVVNVVVGLGLPHPVSDSSSDSFAELIPKQGAPSELTLQDMENRSGRVAFTNEPAEMEQAFPGAARLLGRSRVAALGCSTYLVGMVVPGLHSIYSGLELKFNAGAASPNELRFAVTEVDPRFRRVKIRIDGGGLAGSLDTFSRLPPVSQPSIAEVAKHVARGEFDESIALVVGGSRGLGELTAKLVTAGGGRAIISYASGRADADKLAAEITDWGGNCDVVAYDVRGEADRQLESIKYVPTHLYYFATPSIFRRKSGLCSRERFEEFNEFYVYGFLRLVEAIMRRAPKGIAVFYPSSVAVQDRPNDMTEYAMSKAAGEILCADIARYFRKVRVLTERLPRLQTDQTASLIQVDSVSSLSIMLPIIRKMHERTVAGEGSSTVSRVPADN